MYDYTIETAIAGKVLLENKIKKTKMQWFVNRLDAGREHRILGSYWSRLHPHTN